MDFNLKINFKENGEFNEFKVSINYIISFF